MAKIVLIQGILNALKKGESSGHPFRGNQWTDGEGNASSGTEQDGTREEEPTSPSRKPKKAKSPKQVRQFLGENLTSVSDYEDDPSAVTYNSKTDTFTVRRGFFYSHGKTSQEYSERVSRELSALGVKFQEVGNGTVDLPFKGGAPVKKQSHWWVELKIDM